MTAAVELSHRSTVLPRLRQLLTSGVPVARGALAEALAALRGRPQGCHEDAFAATIQNIAGHKTEHPFGFYFSQLDGTEQALVVELLGSRAAEQIGHERLPKDQPASPQTATVVRARMLERREGGTGDYVGGSPLGYEPGLSVSELWERGRGPWRFDPVRALRCELLLITNPEDTVVAVGTVDKIGLEGDKIFVDGVPFSHHPLIGQRDPLANGSFNPVAWGELNVVVAS